MSQPTSTKRGPGRHHKQGPTVKRQRERAGFGLLAGRTKLEKALAPRGKVSAWARQMSADHNRNEKARKAKEAKAQCSD